MSAELPVQIDLLTDAIALVPDVPVNYLYRAEEWLARGYVAEARADFSAGQNRAADGLRHSAWGYLYQYYLEWAEDGLARCDRQTRFDEPQLY